MPRRLPIYVVVLLTVAQTPSSVFPSDDNAAPISGHTLTQWRQIIQHLDPQDPASTRFVPGLIKVIQSEQVPWFNRRQAALTLGRMGQKAADAVPVLNRLLDKNTSGLDRDTTRLWAAKALALMGPPSAPASIRLADIVRDPSEDLLLRMTALEALGRIGANSPDVLPTFVESLSAEAPAEDELVRLQLRIAAAEALGLLGPAGAPAVPQLIQACQDRSSLLRLPAAITLGSIGPAAEVALPTLVDLVLFDETPEVADAAAKSLGQLGTAALPALTKLLGDREDEVRLRAVWGLTVMGDPAQNALLQTLEDRSPLVAAWAAEGLLTVGSTRKDDAVVRLITLLQDGDRQVRIKAYRTLLGFPELLSTHTDQLQKLAQSPRADVRRAAAGIIQAVRLQGPHSPFNN